MEVAPLIAQRITYAVLISALLLALVAVLDPERGYAAAAILNALAVVILALAKLLRRFQRTRKAGKDK